VNGDSNNGQPSRDPDLRVSDAERDVVAKELGEHFQTGRLTQAEFDERLGQALAARTRRDLDALLADLPRPQEPPAPAPARRNMAVPAVIAVAVGLAALAVVGTVLAATHGHRVLAPWWLIVAVIVLLRRSRWRNTPRGRR
jgi:DUF1707 SHOCT-like domain